MLAIEKNAMEKKQFLIIPRLVLHLIKLSGHISASLPAFLPTAWKHTWSHSSSITTCILYNTPHEVLLPSLHCFVTFLSSFWLVCLTRQLCERLCASLCLSLKPFFLSAFSIDSVHDESCTGEGSGFCYCWSVASAVVSPPCTLVLVFSYKSHVHEDLHSALLNERV